MLARPLVWVSGRSPLASVHVGSVHVCGGLTELTKLGGLQAAQAQLREARDDAAARQEQFEKELATARSLADMNRELASDRAARCTELEGIIRELQRNMEARAGRTGVAAPFCCPSCLAGDGC